MEISSDSAGRRGRMETQENKEPHIGMGPSVQDPYAAHMNGGVARLQEQHPAATGIYSLFGAGGMVFSGGFGSPFSGADRPFERSRSLSANFS